MNTKKVLFKGANWVLAAIITMLGFAGCNKMGVEEYGVPHADYTVKGAVVDKVTGKPIKGIRVGYSPEYWVVPAYGVIPTPFLPKTHVLTNEKGEFALKEIFSMGTLQIVNNVPTLPVYVEDIDGELNGLYESQLLQIDFSKATLTGKPGSWYEGEYIVTRNIELTPVEDNE
ncbi:MAG: radical SAM-associated putative lipoprotein [Bacteroidales bacterium]|nr:radical SAM-associated putative lipoprotein [Bacteroidales bacterium]